VGAQAFYDIRSNCLTSLYDKRRLHALVRLDQCSTMTHVEVSRTPLVEVTQRLDALTSLRFFAAAMIVFHHSIGYGLFGLNDQSIQPSIWGQGVSFFFVLSGFILAHVYPTLDSWPAVRRFWRARIARVWPALAFSLLLAIGLLSLDWDLKLISANLLMVNAWIPYQKYYFSYNAPSWSISAEFFFYLMFPFLIHRWKETWRLKLLLASLTVIAMILLTNTFKLPWQDFTSEKVSAFALLYISPLTRILEFVFGMCVASAWHSRRGEINWSESRASVYELGGILAVVGSMILLPLIAGLIQVRWHEYLATYWLAVSGSMFASGLLIYVAACGKGRIGTWLSHPTMVLLGEISFSLYLIHQILLRYYHTNLVAFPQLPNQVSFAIFFILLLLSSYLSWALVEMPLRKLMLGKSRQKMHGTELMRQSWAQHLNWNRNTGLATLMLGILVVGLGFSFDYAGDTYLKRRNIEASADNLSSYASQGALKTVSRLIDSGLDVNVRSSNGSTPLINASWNGRQSVVVYLLDHHANINAVGTGSLTALTAALYQKHDAVALMLIERGANPNAIGIDGSTPLIEASWHGNMAVVRALLAGGADPNYFRPKDGMTALKAAIGNSKPEVVRILEAAGANHQHFAEPYLIDRYSRP